MNSGVTSRVASSVGIIGKRFWMGGTNEEPIWMWGTTKSRDEVFGLHGRGQKWWATFFQKIGGKKWHWRMLWLIFKVFSEISWCVEKILHHARRTLSPPLQELVLPTLNSDSAIPNCEVITKSTTSFVLKFIFDYFLAIVYKSLMQEQYGAAILKHTTVLFYYPCCYFVANVD